MKRLIKLVSGSDGGFLAESLAKKPEKKDPLEILRVLGNLWTSNFTSLDGPVKEERVFGAGLKFHRGASKTKPALMQVSIL